MRRQTGLLVDTIRIPGNADPERLGSNRLLAALSAGDFSTIAPCLDEVELESGFVIHEAGAPIEHVHFIHSGMVSQLGAAADGQSAEVAAIGREGAVGVMAGLGSPRAVGRAVVQLPVRAARVPAARLADLVRRSERAHHIVIRSSDVLMAQVQQTAACNALHDVQARLSRWLLHAEDRCGGRLRVTQEQISQLLGVQRTTITMVCRVMQSDEVIHIGRGVVDIRDSWALQKRACSCYHVMRTATERMLQDVRGTSADAPAAWDGLMT